MESKLCFVSFRIPPDYAGAGKRVLNQAMFIAKRGYKVSILTTTVCNYNIKNLEVITIKLPEKYNHKGVIGKIFRVLYNPFFLIRLINIIRKNNFKIIHCIPWTSCLSLLSILASKLCGIKVIVETTLFGSDDPISIKKSRMGYIKFFLFKLADRVVNISPLLFESCLQVKMKSDKIFIIGNSVDTLKFTKVSIEEKKELRKELGISQFKHVLLYVGIIRSRKGVEDLIHMFNIVNKNMNDTCLVLAGPINKDNENIMYTDKIRKIVSDYGLNSKVIITGEIKNVDEWMKASDIFVFASKREGFGTVLVEAMSTGLPVVTIDIPKISSYIIKSNYDGIIVDDSKEMAENIIKLLQDKQLYDFISKNARDTVMNRFSQNIIMNSYFDMYNDLLKKDIYKIK